MKVKMKQIFGILFSLLLVLGLMQAMSLMAYAEEPSPEVTLNMPAGWDIPSQSTTGTNSYSNGTYTIQLYGPSGSGYKNNSSYLLLGKKDAYLELPAFDFDVEKIVVTGNSQASTAVHFNMFVNDTAVSTEVTGSTGTQTFEIASDYQSAGNVYRLKVTSNHNVQITKIEIYKKESVAVTGVTISPNTAQEIDVDCITSFTATVEPDDAEDKTVKWSVGGTDAGAVTLYSDADCTQKVGSGASETYTVYALGKSAGTATVTVTSNADSSKTASCDVKVNSVVPVQKVYAITSENFGDCFKRDGSGKLRDIVAEGSVLDFQGTFDKDELKNYTQNGQIYINKKVDVISSTKDAVFHSENSTNYWRFYVSAGADNINVSEIQFENGAFFVTGASNVTVDNISIIANMRGVGSGTGFLSIHTGASNVVIKNSYFENGGTGSACVVLGKGSDHGTFENNTFKITGSSGNVISANIFVGSGEYPSYNTYKNNTIESEIAGSSFSYAMTVCGSGNLVEGNTIIFEGSTLLNQYGADSSDNIYRNNTITSIAGDGKVSINPSANSVVEGNIFEGTVNVAKNSIFTDNIVSGSINISGADNQFSDSDISGTVTVNSNATNLQFIGNDVEGKVVVKADGCTLKENRIISTEEYCVELSSSSNDVEYNLLRAAEKFGDDAVNPGSGSDNVIQNNRGHDHDFTYTASGDTITATCANTDGYCTLDDGTEQHNHAISLSIAAPTLTTYGQTGEGISAEATLDGSDDFNTATGQSVSAENIMYYKAVKSGETYTKGDALNDTPTDAGDYLAEITLMGVKTGEETTGDVTVSAGYTIEKATTTITTAPAAGEITYGQTLADSTLTGGEASVEGSFAWKDSTVAPAVSDSQTTEYDVVFTPTDVNYSTAECKVKLTVNKADAVAATVTANNRAYDETEKPLVTVTGEATGGEMKYAIGTDAATAPTEGWGTSVPAATDAGSYYVWYKVVGDDNHSDADPVCVKVKILNTGMFADIEYGTWKYTAAEAVYDKKIMVGKGMVDGKIIFAPDEKVNRSQLITSIYAMDGKPDVDYVQQFSDVKESDWFAKAVTWAANNDITAGTAAGQFGVKGNATREQVAVMLYKYAKYCGYDVSVSESTTLDGFADADKVHDWALDAVKWAVERKIISGKGSGSNLKIAPDQGATRIECAAMLNRFSEVCTVVVIPDEILEEPLALPTEDMEETPASEDEIEDVIVDEDEEIIDEEDSEVADEESEVVDEEDSEVIDEEKPEVIDEEDADVIDNQETEDY